MKRGTSEAAATFATTLLALFFVAVETWPAGAAELPAFPGAVGQGAAAVGGRGGDVYRVTNLRDYDSRRGEDEIAGSLRHAIESADGARTIVFDVAGPLPLARPLLIESKRLTIAGQTSPGGVTLWGYPVELGDCQDLVIRYLRIRTGDFHARPLESREAAAPEKGGETRDLDASTANGVDVGWGCERVILDHLSVTWGMDETLSVTNARDVTVQQCIIAESLNHSFHPKGDHGFGTLLRGVLTPEDQERGVGGYTFYGNLWAHHNSRNPSVGGQQRLRADQPEAQRGRTDVNLVNNVMYDWGALATYRSLQGDVRINLVGNYYVGGPATTTNYIFKEAEAGRTFVFQEGNCHDANGDGDHNGELIDDPQEVEREFRGFGEADLLAGPGSGKPFNFFDAVAGHVVSADDAYDEVVRAAGASLWRDAVDRRVIDSLVRRTGKLVDSQEQFRDGQGKLPGLDDLATAKRGADFDTDGDGMPNEFESSHGLDPRDPADRNGTGLSPEGYTNLEVYLNSIVGPELQEP